MPEQEVNILEDILAAIEIKRGELGNVDGYDYNSGVEYGLRLASIKIEAAIKRCGTAAPDPRTEELVRALEEIANYSTPIITGMQQIAQQALDNYRGK